VLTTVHLSSHRFWKPKSHKPSSEWKERTRGSTPSSYHHSSFPFVLPSALARVQRGSGSLYRARADGHSISLPSTSLHLPSSLPRRLVISTLNLSLLPPFTNPSLPPPPSIYLPLQNDQRRPSEGRGRTRSLRKGEGRLRQGRHPGGECCWSDGRNRWDGGLI